MVCRSTFIKINVIFSQNPKFIRTWTLTAASSSPRPQAFQPTIEQRGRCITCRRSSQVAKYFFWKCQHSKLISMAFWIITFLAGLALPADTFGSHLHNGETIDEEFERKNFEAAGRVLAEVWDKMEIDGKPLNYCRVCSWRCRRRDQGLPSVRHLQKSPPHPNPVHDYCAQVWWSSLLLAFQDGHRPVLPWKEGPPFDPNQVLNLRPYCTHRSGKCKKSKKYQTDFG